MNYERACLNYFYKKTIILQTKTKKRKGNKCISDVASCFFFFTKGLDELSFKSLFGSHLKAQRAQRKVFTDHPLKNVLMQIAGV